MSAKQTDTSSSILVGAKPVVSLSLDLDNQWSYMKTRNLIITFFIVGQDAALEKNSEALGEIAAAGHEIGNQSFHHEPWLHLHSEQKIEKELILAEDHIERVTGQHPHAGEKGDVFQIISTEKVQGVK